MITSWAQSPLEKRLVERIDQLSHVEADYWSFRKSARREGMHGLIRYPAMMIPGMQAKLLEIIRGERPDVRRMIDPFMGAGTMLTEAMEQGMDFAGYDINPLAILAGKVKAGPFSLSTLPIETAKLLGRINADTGRSYEVNFPGQSKWFTKGATIGLSRIRRAIQKTEDLWLRRFYWLAMAETIRQCSNSRTSTYKLHIRPTAEIDVSASLVAAIFTKTVNSNVHRAVDQCKVFWSNGLLGDDGKYGGQVDVNFQDVTKLDAAGVDRPCDLLFTSPPYGDNATTIPYGQFSFLALNWIPMEDIDSSVPADFNRNTHSIDSASLGGSLRDYVDKAESLFDHSSAFKTFYRTLGGESSYAKRLSGFCFDLHKSVESFAKLMAPQGHMVWTLGNRSMAGHRVPLDEIVFEFLEANNIRRVAKFNRPIPCKRMPTRNSCSDTIHSEVVLIATA